MWRIIEVNSNEGRSIVSCLITQQRTTTKTTLNMTDYYPSQGIIFNDTRQWNVTSVSVVEATHNIRHSRIRRDINTILSSFKKGKWFFSLFKILRRMSLKAVASSRLIITLRVYDFCNVYRNNKLWLRLRRQPVSDRVSDCVTGVFSLLILLTSVSSNRGVFAMKKILKWIYVSWRESLGFLWLFRDLRGTGSDQCCNKILRYCLEHFRVISYIIDHRWQVSEQGIGALEPSIFIEKVT